MCFTENHTSSLGKHMVDFYRRLDNTFEIRSFTTNTDFEACLIWCVYNKHQRFRNSSRSQFEFFTKSRIIYENLFIYSFAYVKYANRADDIFANTFRNHTMA